MSLRFLHNLQLKVTLGVLLASLAPLGIVSVFDSDYATAHRYELEVVSAPPFQAFPPETVEQMAAQGMAASRMCRVNNLMRTLQ